MDEFLNGVLLDQSYHKGLGNGRYYDRVWTRIKDLNTPLDLINELFMETNRQADVRLLRVPAAHAEAVLNCPQAHLVTVRAFLGAVLHLLLLGIDNLL